ncbi:hypothetical protein KJ611_02500 [Patescibacteria group bacterium]|nr:hypothetical protein [Patescibacteria group bacterium]MBU1705887.1 hypothetical protein [Patescibacteria group bacterium]
MTITTHAAIGAVIGRISGNPILAFLFGFFSHFIVDMIPHGDTGLSDNFRVFKRKRKQAVAYSVIDGVFALFFVLLLANMKDIGNMQLYTWGIIGSALPDLLVGFYVVTKVGWLKHFNEIHFFFHDYFVKKRGDVPLKYALIAQVVIVAYLQSKM